MAGKTLTQRVDELEGYQIREETVLEKMQKDITGVQKSIHSIDVVLNNGLKSSVIEIKEQMPHLVTKEDLKLLGIGIPKKEVRRRRLTETAIYAGIFGLAAILIIMFLMGRLTSDDVVKIIFAIRGGG